MDSIQKNVFKLYETGGMVFYNLLGMGWEIVV